MGIFVHILSSRDLMNNKRRALLKKSVEALETASNYISIVLDEEQDSLDNTPENLEGSERYEKMEEAIDKLELALECIDQSEEYVNEACM